MNWNQLNNLMLALLFGGVVFYAINLAKRKDIFLRRIPGLDAVDEAIGRATELGKPVLYMTGAHDMNDPATIAAAIILGRVAKKAASYETELLVPHREPITMAVCQEITKQAYMEAGKPDLFKDDANFFITSDQFSYTAAVDGIMLRRKPAANFFMGSYFAESLLLTETGASTGAIQIAGTDSDHQLPFFVTTCDYTLIGEELYAASAYLSKEPIQVGTLRGQDLGKAFILGVIGVGTVARHHRRRHRRRLAATSPRPLQGSEMIFLRRQLPLLITMVTGLVMAAQYYVPHPASEQLLTTVTKWLQIIGGFALVLGITSLFHVHAAKIRRKEAGWGYSLVLYAGMLGTIVVGLWNGGKESIEGAMTSFGWVYSYTLVPLQGTMFAILAFFIASAAYRSFRARSREAAVLLIAAVIVMMGRVPLGEYLLPISGDLSSWILNVLNASVRRAILIGVSLGAVALSFKIIFGVERSYLGGGKE